MVVAKALVRSKKATPLVERMPRDFYVIANVQEKIDS
jgi:hypothetical protein